VVLDQRILPMQKLLALFVECYIERRRHVISLGLNLVESFEFHSVFLLLLHPLEVCERAHFFLLHSYQGGYSKPNLHNRALWLLEL
jgi:hypothetical protein